MEGFDLIIDNNLTNINWDEFIKNNQNKKNIKIDLDSNEIFNRYRELIDFFISNTDSTLTFTKELHFFNNLPFFNFTKCIFNKNIEFNEIILEKEFTIMNSIFKGNLIFSSCIFEQNFSFVGIKNNLSKVKLLEFNNCDFKQICKIDYLEIDKESKVENCVCNSFIFRNTIMNNTIIFKNNSIIYTLNIRNNTNVNNKFILDKCKLEGNIFITENEFNLLQINSLKKEGEDITLLRIENYNYLISELVINSIYTVDSIKLIGPKLNKCFNKIILESCDFLNGENKEYFFKNFDSKKFVINNCTNFSNKLIFQNLELEKIEIRNSDLGKTTFNGVEIYKLYLENVTLNDCIFNGVDFPKNYKLENNYKYIKKNKEKKSVNLKNKQLKDNYRQLKYVMDSNGNITEANNFFEKEMEYYEKELAENGFSQKRIILLIQKWISNYGGNWLRVIGWIFLLGLITAFISYYYMFNIKKIEIDFIKSFLFFLYPLYGLKKDFFEGFDKLMLFGFMSYKLIYGILLWHLVVALKRTTKR